MRVQFGGTRSRRCVAASQHNDEGQAAAAHRLDHAPIAAPDTLLREGQLAVSVAGGHVHAGEVEHQVGSRTVEHGGKTLWSVSRYSASPTPSFNGTSRLERIFATG